MYASSGRVFLFQDHIFMKQLSTLTNILYFYRHNIPNNGTLNRQRSQIPKKTTYKSILKFVSELLFITPVVVTTIDSYFELRFELFCVLFGTIPQLGYHTSLIEYYKPINIES